MDEIVSLLVGEMTKESVCGMDVSPDTPAGTVAYDGRPYYFGSEPGRIPFTEDPAVFRPDLPHAVQRGGQADRRPHGHRRDHGGLRKVEANLREETGAGVMDEADPARLVNRLLERYRSASYVCPCRPRPRSGQHR
jgi:YHS domain-containing protein